MLALEIGIAFILDLILGDPLWFPHPVRAIGWLISCLENITRKLFSNKKLAGFFTGILVLSITVVFVWGSTWLAGKINSFLGIAVEIIWIYLGLSTKSLADAALPVFKALSEGDIVEGRKYVSYIVSRNTEELNEEELSRATIETVAENTVDGIITPLFFALLGGAPAMWLFKAASTCDSMIGYKNERYLEFGNFSARFDDLLNYIPARISWILFPIGALFTGLSASNCWKIATRDHMHHDSPNAGIPEAAISGALEIRLGGPTVYNGKLKEKEYFGGEFNPPVKGDIKKSIILMRATSSLMAVLSIIISYICL